MLISNTNKDDLDTMELEALYRDYQQDPVFEHLRTQPGVKFVPGHGPIKPDIMLIGESPGRVENAKRIPFTGQAGMILNDLLLTINVDPSKVFMTNVIKYWPQDPDDPGKTRTPEPKELKAARNYIIEEIDIVDPLLVGLCGGSALRTIFPEKTGIYKWRGKLLDDTYVVLYHPALIGYRPEKRPLVQSTFFKLKEYLEKIKNND